MWKLQNTQHLLQHRNHKPIALTASKDNVIDCDVIAALDVAILEEALVVLVIGLTDEESSEKTIITYYKHSNKSIITYANFLVVKKTRIVL